MTNLKPCLARQISPWLAAIPVVAALCFVTPAFGKVAMPRLGQPADVKGAMSC